MAKASDFAIEIKTSKQSADGARTSNSVKLTLPIAVIVVAVGFILSGGDVGTLEWLAKLARGLLN